MKSITMKRTLIIQAMILSLLLVSLKTSAQDKSYETIFISTQNGLMQSVEQPARGELKMHIAHRFGRLNGGFYDLFGLDEATMRLAFEWGATDWLGVALGRSTWEKTYDLGTKIALFRHDGADFNIASSLFAEWSVNTLRGYFPENEENLGSRSTLNLQLLLAAGYKRLSLQISPVIMRNNYDLRAGGSINLFALPLTGSINLTKRMGISAEYVPVFNKPFYADVNPLTFSFDIDTGGHQFHLLFSNSRGLTYKSILTNTDTRWTEGGIYFGFNLVRTFYL
jgi:hypothetical protein